jgi:hypothetical protein
MNRFFFFICALLLPFFSISAFETDVLQDIDSTQSTYTFPPELSCEYPYNPSVSEGEWNHLKQFFLPPDHPIKSKLDKIFSASRVTLNEETVLQAGFPKNTIRSTSKIVVSSHPKLKGYLVKFYLDEQDISDYVWMVRRLEGARSIREAIKAHGYEKMLSVPNKWIYPLPLEPSPPPGSHRKNFILVVEDMHIYKGKTNKKLWVKKIDHERAEALYTLLQEVGLSDSIYRFNVPFCKDGRQSFIDTEYHHHWPVAVDRMLPFFSSAVQEHWFYLMHKDTP